MVELWEMRKCEGELCMSYYMSAMISQACQEFTCTWLAALVHLDLET